MGATTPSSWKACANRGATTAESTSTRCCCRPPVTRRLEMVAPTKFSASLSQPALKADAPSGQSAEQLPVYNVYSIDGDVTGDLVYVNCGVPADYEGLDRRGIDVKGRIVIARYGGSWRGSSRRWRPNAAPSAVSSARTRATMGTSRAMCPRRAGGGPSRAPSAARWPTCRSTPAIRSRPAWAPPPTRRARRTTRTPRSSPFTECRAPARPPRGPR